MSKEINGTIISCEIPQGLNQKYSYSLELSYDNISFSKPIDKALEFASMIRVKQYSADYMMPDSRRWREIGIIMI